MSQESQFALLARSPQRLKPFEVATRYGTAEAVPLTKRVNRMAAAATMAITAVSATSVATVAVALCFLVSIGSPAQISNPDKLIAPTPRNPARTQHPPTTEDMQWLWAFTKPQPNGRAYDLRVDWRFQSMLERSFKQPQAMWGPDDVHPPLATVIPLFLTQYGAVNSENNRYITVDGCVHSFCPAHGMLWVDVGTAHPLMVFAAVNWTTESHTTDEATADYDLWLFPNRQLDANSIPLALSESIAHWDARLASAHRGVAHVSHAIIVEPTGEPFAIDPSMAGANTLKPQPDTITPKDPDDE